MERLAYDIVAVDERDHPFRDGAVELLVQFFNEEGFTTQRGRIAANIDTMIGDDTCWVAVMVMGNRPVGIVTVTTMLYVEWGRLAEIGDLYIVLDFRGRGFARRLVGAAIDWARQRGCTGTFVTLAPEGEARHELSRFYGRLNFRATGRTTMVHTAPA